MANQRANGLRSALLALALAALAPAIASAQDTDPRLVPWLGCWEPATGADVGDLLCVQPASQNEAVEVVRLSGNEIVSRELVWADGARHETARDKCDGWEQGTFSRDGRRLFIKSEYTCESGAAEQGAGIMAMAAPDEWLDVRVAGEEGDRMAWVQHYRLADKDKTEAAGFADLLTDQAWNARTARMVASAPLDVDDVIEASAQVPHEAVEALLAERGDRLDLDSKELVRMADAGVAESTIDVAVAVSYPETFQVAQGARPERAPVDETDLDRRWGYRGYGLYNPYYLDPFYRYGYYGYGYGPGYGGYYGGYWGGYGYVPTVVVVDRQSRQHIRVVNGRGYTRGGSSAGASRTYVPSGSRPSASGSSGGRTAKPRGGVSRSSGGASSAAAPSSSRGSSTGRTAKPRGSGRGR